MAKKIAKTQITSAVSAVEGWARLIKLGKLAFFGGVLAAIVAGFVEIPYLAIILAVAGLIIGFLNIAAGEAKTFLISAIALLLVGTSVLGAFAVVGTFIESILKNIIVLVGPATLVVALKTVLTISQPK